MQLFRDNSMQPLQHLSLLCGLSLFLSHTYTHTHIGTQMKRGERIIKLQIYFGFQLLQCFSALLFRYVHSYQSYLWNHAASLRAQKYGMLSFVSSEYKFHGSFYCMYYINYVMLGCQIISFIMEVFKKFE